MTKVLLNDVVNKISDKIDKETCGLDYYIGGEHFDSRSVVIRKKGVIKGSTIGPAFQMRFKPNDVLLMSRNPHLRKAGIVDFCGVCSDVSYVIRTKDENILRQRFIPYIFQSDDFWNFAEKNKKGSTNFFLNWSDFAKYEFFLPSIEDQDKLLSILEPISNNIEILNSSILDAEGLKKSMFFNYFGDPIKNTKNFKTDVLSNVCNFKFKDKLIEKEKYLNLNLEDIESNTGEILSLKYDDLSNIGPSTFFFKKGTLLYSKLRPYLNKVVIAPDDGFATTELIPLFPNEKITKCFLLHLLRSDFFVSWIINQSNGTKMPRASMDTFRNFELIIPDIKLQREFETKIDELICFKNKLISKRDSIQILFQSLINKYISAKEE